MADRRPDVLDYAKPPARHAGVWRWVRRAAVVVAVVVGALALASYVGNRIWWAIARAREDAQARAALARIAAYRPPADRVVYDDDPVRLGALLARPGYAEFASSRDMPDRGYAYYTDPACETTRAAHDATLFAGHLTAPDGSSKVVEVYLDPWPTLGTWGDVAGRRAWLLQSATLTAGPPAWVARGNVTTHPLPFSPDDPRPLRFFAGQLDPADPARFTIRYELGDTAGVVDGRLTPGGDVRLEFRAP